MEQFYEYLISKGYDKITAKELLKRVEGGIGDYIDEEELTRYTLSLSKEVKNE